MASTDTTRRAVFDILAHGLRGDLVRSAVGAELGSQLQSATTADIGEGATPAEVLEAMREACGQDAVAYARLLELHVLAALDELQLIAGISSGDEVARTLPDMPPAPSRRSARRRR